MTKILQIPIEECLLCPYSLEVGVDGPGRHFVRCYFGSHIRTILLRRSEDGIERQPQDCPLPDSKVAV